MLKNYEKDKFGVIHQIMRNKFNYDLEYVHKRYDEYGELTKRMSHLRLGYIIGVINKYPKTILDVGYGNGDFLRTCLNVIPKCYGNDVSGYQIPENCEFVDNIFTKEFDVITFFDSLEHFENIDFMSELKCNYVIISLPWFHNFSDEWFYNWKHRRENEHLHHFSDKSLIKFMKHHNFECISITNIEDIIRKPIDDHKNILTGVFKKIK